MLRYAVRYEAQNGVVRRRQKREELRLPGVRLRNRLIGTLAALRLGEIHLLRMDEFQCGELHPGRGFSSPGGFGFSLRRGPARKVPLDGPVVDFFLREGPGAPETYTVSSPT